MLDHITIQVRNLAKSKNFYDAVLESLGMKIVLSNTKKSFWGYGVKEDPIFEIAQATKSSPAHKRVHIAFKAKNRKSVDAFYKTAIAAGGKDNGPPGPRPNYTPSYYAAFVRDPDGNNIEACIY